MGNGCASAFTASCPPYGRRRPPSAVKLRWALVLSAVAAALVPLNAERVERWYSTGVYPHVQAVITPVSNRVGVALLDLSVALGIVGIAWVLSRRIWRLGVLRGFL